MNCYRRNLHYGFTLIELIVVVAILSIFTGAALMNFASYKTKRDIENDIKQLYADLLKARAMAVTGVRSVQVVFSDADSKSYTLLTDINEDGEFKDKGEIYTASLKLDVFWNGDPAKGSNITFSSKGLPNSNGTFSINGSGAEYNCITVFSTRINLGRLAGGECEP